MNDPLMDVSGSNHRCFREQWQTLRRIGRCLRDLHGMPVHIDKDSVTVRDVPKSKALKLAKRMLDKTEYRALITVTTQGPNFQFWSFGNL